MYVRILIIIFYHVTIMMNLHGMEGENALSGTTRNDISFSRFTNFATFNTTRNYAMRDIL